MKKLSVLALLIAVSALAGCEYVANALTPSVTGGPNPAQSIEIVPLDETKLGTPSGTSAGMRIARFRSDLPKLQQAAVQQVDRAEQLRADLEASVAAYQSAVGTLSPTEPSGPVSDASLGTWQAAQGQLQTISATLDQMSGLSSGVAKNVAYAAFLLQSIRETKTAADATPEDQGQLQVLEESAKQTSGALDRLLNGLRHDVLRQSHFLGSEGAKLAQLAPPSAAPNAAMATQPQAAPSAHVAAPAGAGLATGRPFVVIRFDNPGVEYEQQLYEAVSAALARYPDVAFDLVGVTPETGSPEELAQNTEAARASMEKVMRSLMGMGFPSERVSISQVTDPNVQSNEVQLYVR